MKGIADALDAILRAQEETQKPLAIILAGHNGSGKSTMWRRTLAGKLQIPLVNADRMMLSILPEADGEGHLVLWAARFRDTNPDWMRVAQQGVQAFVGHAMGAGVPFAMETVFSYWERQADGTIASKIGLIRDMQTAGYFVLLLFVGLTSDDLSVLRVLTRVMEGGHGIDEATLRKRFPKTQKAISEAVKVADASVLVDNSMVLAQAFSVCRVKLGTVSLFDIRDSTRKPSPVITAWMEAVSPR